jgi:hypothetical protein
LKKRHHKTTKESEDIASLARHTRDKKAIIQLMSLVHHWKDIEKPLKEKFRSVRVIKSLRQANTTR